MLNIAFPELMVIFVVALIVIGPEKLPKIARGAGLLLGRLQRQVNSVKSEINMELQNEDLKRLQDELNKHEMGLNEDLRKGMQPVASVIHGNKKSKTDDKQSVTSPDQLSNLDTDVNDATETKTSVAE